MDRKTVDEMLEGAKRKDFIEIISKMSLLSYDAEQIILDWCKKHNGSHQKKALELELENLWGEAREIISDFNEYGGGPEDDEETAADNLWKMDEIVKNNEINWECRAEILDEMLYEADLGNSGFDDLLIDVAESFCKTDEEVRYLADALSKGSSSYYRGYASRLYKNIGDEEQFLQTKLANLQYGTDYLEIAKYYAKHKNREKQLEYVWKGLEKCSGRLDELVNYVAPIYIQEQNDDELRRLYHFILKTKWDVNIRAVAEQLYEYSRTRGDESSKKKMLMLLLDTCDSRDVQKWFQVSKRELPPEEWEAEYEMIMEKVKKKNLIFYLDICMETGREEIVLKHLQNENHAYGYWNVDHDQYFSKRLAVKYPDEVLALYWQDVNNFLRVTNNKNYQATVSFLKKIKALMKKNGKQAEWERQFYELKEKHKKKRNFMALLRKL